jgi:hypothetical protein
MEHLVQHIMALTVGGLSILAVAACQTLAARSPSDGSRTYHPGRRVRFRVRRS